MRKSSLIFLPLLFIAFAASAQTIPVDLEIGYRWSNVDGNENLYRSQINERDGFMIRSLTFFTNGPASTDFRIDATDLGAGPVSSIRVNTGKSDSYRLRLGYRSIDSFNNVPAFELHTIDRTRTMFDADLEVLSLSSKFTPFIGYSWARNQGPGTLTYALGADEFRLGSDLDETDREFRVGSSFNFGKVTGQVTQGWRTLKSEELLSLTTLAGGGMNPGSILGKPISADTITRNSKTNVDAPFTNAYVMADFIPRVKLIGDFYRFSSESTGDEVEAATGSFVSFGIARFFQGLTETTSSNAKNDTWRGGARAEITITDAITFQAGYRTEHRELEGAGIISSLYRDTLTFGGLDPRNVEEVLLSSSALDRDEDVISGILSIRTAGPLTFRVGYSVADQKFDIAQDLSEIVVPGNQDGVFNRSVKTFDATATFSKRLFSIGGSWRTDSADTAVLRTDFVDRNRLRVRASFHTPGNLFRAGVTAEDTKQSNDITGVEFDATGRQYIADLEIAPVAALRLRGSYAQFKADSTITTRRPETFALDTSVYEEDGTSIEGGIGLLVKKASIDASIARFDNDGSLPFTMDRYRVRAGYDFVPRVGFIVEWSQDEYQESAASGHFDAHRYGLFLHLRP